jgi:hypothetical protein
MERREKRGWEGERDRERDQKCRISDKIALVVG